LAAREWLSVTTGALTGPSTSYWTVIPFAVIFIASHPRELGAHETAL